MITLSLFLFGITTIVVSFFASVALAVPMIIYQFFPGVWDWLVGLFSFLPFIG